MAVFFSLSLLNEIERIENIPRRIFRDREDAFSLRDEVFVRFFRLSKEAAIYVIEKIKEQLPQEGFPPHLRVLVALRFYAAGGYQSTVGNDFCLNVSQMSVSRCLTSVSHAICQRLLPEEVRFPVTREEEHHIKRSFYSNFGLPGCIGAIDCTHVAIKQPIDDAPHMRSNSYYSRKHHYSINVQLVCDNELLIRAVNAKFPGSVHDAFIWQQSIIREYLAQKYDQGRNCGWLLGDSGYPLEPWLITPFNDPAPNTVEERFNSKHSSARNCIERCNGVLKQRFRCILKHRVLHYEPTQASRIINACVVLHNICIKRNVALYEEDDSEEEENDEENDDSDSDEDNTYATNHISLRVEGARRRDDICNSL